MSDKDWLKPWVPQLRDASVLELGSGSGEDARYIAQHCAQLTASDILRPQIEGANIDNQQINLNAPIALPLASYDVIVASLCLHYFSQTKTRFIVAQLRQLLTSTGLLIARVNAADDFEFGGNGRAGFYWVRGRYKRFFDRDSIELLFAQHWRLHDLKHCTIDRYQKPKSVWQFCASLRPLSTCHISS